MFSVEYSQLLTTDGRSLDETQDTPIVDTESVNVKVRCLSIQKLSSGAL